MRMRKKPNLIPRLERCAHVLMLDQGRLVYQGPPAGFTGRVAKRVFSFVPPSGEARAMLARW